MRELFIISAGALVLGIACDDQLYTSRYHSEGWEVPEVHGAVAVQQADTCTDCHGPSLEGSGEAPSCDSCHEPGWAEDCSYCHGAAEQSFAPLAGTTDRFLAHDPHLQGTLWSGTDCETCHVVPQSALDPGHAWVSDDTPGAAEVVFTGLAEGTTWDGNGTCSESYCHGPVASDGVAVHTDSYAEDCSSCHASQDAADADRWVELGGQHAVHLSISDGEPPSCKNCHRQVVDEYGNWQHDTGRYGSSEGLGTVLHVDGAISLWGPETLEGDALYDSGTCTGQCHGENHEGRLWYE